MPFESSSQHRFGLREGAVEGVVDLVLDKRGLSREEARSDGFIVHPGHVARLVSPAERRLSRLEELSFFIYFLFVPRHGLLCPRGYWSKSLTVEKIVSPRSDPGLAVGLFGRGNYRTYVSRDLWVDALDESPHDHPGSIARLEAIAEEVVTVANELLILADRISLTDQGDAEKPTSARYLPLDLPRFFEFQAFGDGVWIGEARLRREQFTRQDDGSYVGSAGGSPIWFRCIAQFPEHFVHVDGGGEHFIYRLIPLHEDGSVAR